MSYSTKILRPFDLKISGIIVQALGLQVYEILEILVAQCAHHVHSKFRAKKSEHFQF